MLIPANMLSFRLGRAINAQLERISWTRLAGYFMSPCELRALMMGVDRRYVNQVLKAVDMHPDCAVALLCLGTDHTCWPGPWGLAGCADVKCQRASR